MGKGDPRTRKGKIFKGSFGKARPQRPRKKVVTKAPETASE
jgi:30S ribosomal protein S31